MPPQAKSQSQYSVGIAVSGLGRIRRGSETWAVDLATALAEGGVRVRLFGAGPVQGSVPVEVVPTLCRTSRLLAWLGPQKRYLVEQKLFVRSLLKRVRRDPPSVLHLTDPQVAWWARDALRGTGIPVFYMDGLMLGPDWNWRFDHVQVLAPYYLETARDAGRDTKGWRVIPHFIAPERFEPPSGDQRCRGGILSEVPAERRIALAVGDFAPGSSKRLEHVITEVGSIPEAHRPHLVLAGNATDAERQRLEHLAGTHLGRGFTLFASLPRERMAELYRAADVFVHAALREPFGIVLLEAMSTGLPVIAHQFPVTAWIVGTGGWTGDLAKNGVLAGLTEAACRNPDGLRRVGSAARDRVRDSFSAGAILPRYLEAYRDIVGGG